MPLRLNSTCKGKLTLEIIKELVHPHQVEEPDKAIEKSLGWNYPNQPKEVDQCLAKTLVCCLLGRAKQAERKSLNSILLTKCHP